MSQHDKNLSLAWMASNLVCPVHKQQVTCVNQQLIQCVCGCHYPVVDGVPIMLVSDASQTIGLAEASLRQATLPAESGGWYLDSLGIADAEKADLRALIDSGTFLVDPVVSHMVSATNGIAYAALRGKLRRYPIPQLRLPDANHGEVLLDIGCNWGRWSLAAAAKNYRVIGIDPSLGAVMAARRVASELGLNPRFVVGDARHLPFLDQSIDTVFSYSVIQHFSREDAALSAGEIGRVLKPGGQSMIQMPSVFGLRCLYHQSRRGFREGADFDVRYWTLPALKNLFEKAVGKTNFSVDCYFGIGLQRTDMDLMPPTLKLVVWLSELLRKFSKTLPFMKYLADSVYVHARKTIKSPFETSRAPSI